jgi:nucleoside-diphosphate-sugar epimerase
MNVLITGATGFIGSHLAERLYAKGHSLRCLVRPTSDLHWIRHLPVEYIYGDLFDERALTSAVRDVDYVYHLAGVTKARTPEEYFKGNHDTTSNLLAIVRSHHPKLQRFIHVSSQAAVGPSSPGAVVNEASLYRPITTYGKSKMAAEKECLNAMKELPITIVRPPAVYGPRDKDIFEFFNTMNKRLQPMIGFNKKTVSLIHVRDLVDGIILAGEHPSGAGQTYFISSERFYNWKEVGEVTSHILGKKALRVNVPEFAVYIIAGISELYSMVTRQAVLINLEKAKDIVQDAWTCSVEKAVRELGYHQKLSLEEGIKETVAWYKTNKWL